MGGQKSERKKWLHFFDDVKVILVLLDISEFDEKCNNEAFSCPMHESLELCKQLGATKELSHCAFIFCFNKAGMSLMSLLLS